MFSGEKTHTIHQTFQPFLNIIHRWLKKKKTTHLEYQIPFGVLRRPLRSEWKKQRIIPSWSETWGIHRLSLHWYLLVPSFWISKNTFMMIYFTYYKNHPLKVYDSGTLVYPTELYTHHHNLSLPPFHHPKKTYHSHQRVTPSHLPPQLQTTLFFHFLYLVHVSGLLQYTAFCDWFLSLTLFSRFIHVVASIYTLFLFIFK